MQKNASDLRNRFLTRSGELISGVGQSGGRSAFARVGAMGDLDAAKGKLDDQEKIFTHDVSAPNYAIIFSSAQEREKSEVVKLLAQKREALGRLETELNSATTPQAIKEIGDKAKAILDAETRIHTGSVAMAIQEERRKTAVGTTEAFRDAQTAVSAIRLGANERKKGNLGFQLEQVQNDRDVVNSTRDVKRNQSQKRQEYARIKREAETIVAEEAKVPPPVVEEAEPAVTPAPPEVTPDVTETTVVIQSTVTTAEPETSWYDTRGSNVVYKASCTLNTDNGQMSVADYQTQTGQTVTPVYQWLLFEKSGGDYKVLNPAYLLFQMGEKYIVGKKYPLVLYTDEVQQDRV